jgi:hypothetical protein
VPSGATTFSLLSANSPKLQLTTDYWPLIILVAANILVIWLGSHLARQAALRQLRNNG